MGYSVYVQEGTFQHTAARRRLGAIKLYLVARLFEFQHTAARRRLGIYHAKAVFKTGVSTHSRPKAAGLAFMLYPDPSGVSTHSRPKAAG